MTATTPLIEKAARALGPVSLRELSGSHKLQNHAGRAADGHLALFPTPDGAEVRDTQQCGQLRLGEAVSLANGFDFSGGHGVSLAARSAKFLSSGLGIRVFCSNPGWGAVPTRGLRPCWLRNEQGSGRPRIPGDIRDLSCHRAYGGRRSQSTAATKVKSPALRRASRLSAGRCNAALYRGGHSASEFFVPLGAGNAPNEALGGLGGEKSVSHFHSPLSGGALPRSVSPLWGTMSSLSKEISAKSQIIFEGADT